MDARGRSCSSPSSQSNEEDMDLRRGPWTVEEDLILVNYIANHGEGRWNALARCAGLKRTGKSCRLRWLNYLRPDVRRGNITPEEQLLILELHSRWGNRWSKIAQHLPGRTDNEIKNYWRTRVQKQAKQLRCDVNSKQFKDAMRYLWMPRLVERIQAANARADGMARTQPSWPTGYDVCGAALQGNPAPGQAPESSFGNAVSSDSSAGLSVQDVSHDGSASESLADCYFPQQPQGSDYYSSSCGNTDFKPEWDTIVCPDAPLISPHGCYYYNQYDQNFDQYYKTHEEGASAPPPPPPLPMETSSGGWLGGDLPNSSWNVDDMLFWRQQLCDDGLPL